MAYPSIPSSAYHPLQPLFFLKSHPKTHSLQIFRAKRLGLSCCQQTVHLETHQKTNLVKKKRKPRPSFLEQVQTKWSLKTPSLRENFPWQEQESSGLNKRFQEDEPSVSASDGSCEEEESGKSGSVSVPVSSCMQVKSVLPPWVHGIEPRRKGFDSESVERSNFDEMPEKIEVSSGEESENVASHVPRRKGFDSEDSEKSKFDEILVAMPEKIEVSRAEESKNVALEDDSSTLYPILRNLDDSAGVSDLNRLPWEKRMDVEKEDKMRKRNTEVAERLIPEHELKRLRNESMRMMERIKVGSAGVTQALVDAIHEKWKNDEVVKLKFQGPPSKNMTRTHKFLESRTGGVVIWRSGSSVVLYRGMTYKLDCIKSYANHVQADGESLQENSPQGTKDKRLKKVYSSNYFKNLSEEEQMDLSELNLLLDGLGPRFIDWSGREPVPVDADLLPAVIPGYKTPFRLLPHGTRQALKDKEMTYLRRTARTMPPHFALGRNRELQGLAMAMVKLWEKSAIAKIAVKRGVLNTSNERMAEELKTLTGGTLVSRNKEFIVFYRGNDFLPPCISTTLKEAEKFSAIQQDEEEQARHRAAKMIDPKAQESKQPLVAGTLAETLAATSRWSNQINGAEMEKMKRDTAVSRHVSFINSLEKKLALAKGKIRKAERALQKVLENQEPEDLPTDLETLTDEERFLFRRIGLSMKPFLVLGRREVFDGTIENMHLHWKYRELVKILVERKTYSQVKHIALSLEAESGGVLVALDKTTKGYIIIVYRGKNYQRPLAFRPKTLLTKRQALARSIELQRREALKHHVLELEENIEKLKQELEDMMAANNNGTEMLDLRTLVGACDDDDEDGGRSNSPSPEAWN